MVLVGVSLTGSNNRLAISAYQDQAALMCSDCERQNNGPAETACKGWVGENRGVAVSNFSTRSVSPRGLMMALATGT